MSESSDNEDENSISDDSSEDAIDWDNAFANEQKIEKQLEDIRNGVM